MKRLKELFLNAEQSKHLQELGLDMSDASLCLMKIKDNEYITTHFKSFKSLTKYFEKHEELHKIKDIVPIYSFQEILEKLPDKIIDNTESIYYLDINYQTHEISYSFKEFSNDEPKSIKYADYTEYKLYNIFFDDSDLLHSLYSTLCWVIEEGYLKIK